MRVTPTFLVMKVSHCALLASLCFVSNGLSAGMVTNCTEQLFREALSGGGLVEFACDGQITLSNVITISTNTVVDASGHDVTLSGGGRVRIFQVAPGVSLNLTHLTVSDAMAIGKPGQLLATSHTLVDPEDSEGGAISGTNASVTIKSCVFTNNAARGGDIYSDHHVSVFSRISASAGGAVSIRDGFLEISDSHFIHNVAITPIQTTDSSFFDKAEGFARGGAIAVTNCTIAITNSIFTGNTSGTPGGGAIYAENSFAGIDGCSFDSNEASGRGRGVGYVTPPGSGRGGALLATNSSVELVDVIFTQNTTIGPSGYSDAAQPAEGGAVFANNSLKIDGSSFEGNVASGDASGGAVCSSGGTIEISNFRFRGNSAIGTDDYSAPRPPQEPGSGLGGAISAYGALSLANASFLSNSVRAGRVRGMFGEDMGSDRLGKGGAIYATGPVSGTNLTLAFNSATAFHTNLLAGGGLFLGGVSNVLSYCTLASNSITLLGSTAEGNQYAIEIASREISTETNGIVNIHASILTDGSSNLIDGAFVDLGYNVSSDDSFTNSTSQGHADARLRSPTLNGGKIETMALGKGSPALDAGDPSAFPPIDARGVARPVGNLPDIGAFEYSLAYSQSLCR